MSKTKSRSREQKKKAHERSKKMSGQRIIDRLMSKIVVAGSDREHILYQQAGDFDLNLAEERANAKRIVDDLFSVLSATRMGVGLAANQIGETGSAIVWKKTPNDTADYMINPKVVETGKSIQSMFEGCLSYPGFVVEVERPQSVTIEWRTLNNEQKVKQFLGWEARILQHEIDHLRGICAVGQSDEKDRKYPSKK